ncbi:MAG: hypothetical protein A2259_02110 [Candidatus Moranbacteria bacterium RIFOXYA2_FULL_43_15]|nr:MAG: hypothetical protein A2259_02110 [Candidatus Moranbacteria bacterium RIFOXYA2_FULL_43_15]
MKVALVHDFLTAYGGAERVLEVFCEMFPEAPIYTLLYDKEKMRGKFSDKVIQTSFLQKFPKFLRKRSQYLLPLLPTAPETFDLREYDLVISSSGAWSKGIVTRLNTLHIAYIHSPMRFVWDYNEKYLKEDRCGRMSFLARPFLSYLRIWDKMAADRPDHLIANSEYTRKRIRKYYGRESTVIHPPVVTSSFSPVPGGDVWRNRQTERAQSRVRPLPSPLPITGEGGKYFLIVSRLSPYKKIDAAVEAFNKLELPLVVVGEGKQEKYLKSIAGNNIQFLGWQADEKIEEIYANARAFVFPGVDDFGLSAAEAMTRGVPIVAIRKGGALEIVEEGKTGEFFDAATPEVLADGVRRFMENEGNYDKNYIKQKAERFGKERFVREFREFIDKMDENSPNCLIT